MRQLVIAPLVLASCAAPVNRPNVDSGRMLSARAEEPLRVERVLSQARALLPASRTVEAAGVFTDTTGATEVHLQQRHRGVALRHLDLPAVVLPGGEVQLQRAPDVIGDVDVQPRIDEPSALAIVADEAARRGLSLANARAELMLDPIVRQEPIYERGRHVGYLPRVDGAVLRWIISAELDGKSWSFTVDAHTGELGDEGDQRARAIAGFEHGMWDYERLPTYPRSDFSYTLTDAWGGNYKQCDTMSTCASPLLFMQVGSNSWGNGTPVILGAANSYATYQTQAAEAYIGTFAALTSFRDFYAWNGWNGAGAAITVETNHGYNNSWFDNGTVKLGYANWDGATPGTPLVPWGSIDAMAHEIGHGIFLTRTHQNPSGSSGETAGLWEGSSDIFAAIATWYTRTALVPAGQIAFTDGTSLAGLWTILEHEFPSSPRSFIDPPVWQWDPTINSTNMDGHFALGPICHMFYFLSVGVLPKGVTWPPPGSDPLQPQRSSPYLPRGLTGIQIDQAAQIWFRALHFWMPNDTFLGARQHMLDAVSQLDNNLGEDGSVTPSYSLRYKAVQDAFAAINVGEQADRDPPSFNLVVTQTSARAAVATFTISDEHNIGSAVISFPGGHTYSCLSNCTIDLYTSWFTDGLNMAVVSASDDENNSTSKKIGFTIDKAGPTIGTLSDDAPTTPGNLRHYTVSASDPNLVASLTLSSEGVTVSVPILIPEETVGAHGVAFDVTPLSNGSHTLTATAKDRFGNISQKSITITVDHAPPEQCAITSEMVDQGCMLVTGPLHDNGSAVVEDKVYVDGALVSDQQLSSGQTTLSYLYSDSCGYGLGQHTVELDCVDAWGNVATFQQTYTVTSGPTVSLSASVPQSGHIYTNATFDSSLGIKRAEVLVDCPSSTHTEVLADVYPAQPYPTHFQLSPSQLLTETGTCTVIATGWDATGTAVSKTQSVYLGAACTDSFSANGANDPNTYFVNVGRTSGKFELDYDTYDVPDQLYLSCADGGNVDGVATATTGCVGTVDPLKTQFSFACSSPWIRVDVTPNCTGTDHTEWNFSLACATQ